MSDETKPTAAEEMVAKVEAVAACAAVFDTWAKNTYGESLTGVQERWARVGWFAALAQIAVLLPATFYADRPLPERIRLLVEHWQRAIAVNQQLDPAYIEADLSTATGFSQWWAEVGNGEEIEQSNPKLSHEAAYLRGRRDAMSARDDLLRQLIALLTAREVAFKAAAMEIDSHERAVRVALAEETRWFRAKLRAIVGEAAQTEGGE